MILNTICNISIISIIIFGKGKLHAEKKVDINSFPEKTGLRLEVSID